MNILIIGASGGIGHALALSISERYPEALIHGTYGKHKPHSNTQIHWHALDLMDNQAITQLCQQFTRLDWVIYAAGVLHQERHRPEKSINQFDSEWGMTSLQINSLAPLLVAKHCQSALKQSLNSKFVVLSARVGSIEDNRLGGWYSYRISKAALNMGMKSLSIEWQRMLPNCGVLMLHPGTVDSRLSKPFQQRLPQGQLQQASDCANALIKVIEDTTAETSGQFLDYRGQTIPW
ncbi:SDR family NAD(P)-dependent oxidoreductase [Ferrimonas aestuarii]|uniref:SDR family NAD(P)-dependent oxidoreductase n=1 Tax=Ferrimonas aestuarii TaxID=2569539 RepID=A0A4U1BNZ8_9GAMM|nr:SDR family NAD(P)-dependent oxidoreductase [Ferrimonas aestuarii]TKB55510.1 SDR family NAD(P)-dependent oxidoreductase [Ferrimonas aestuarii]